VYGLNNPVLYTDPSGESALLLLGAAALYAAGGVAYWNLVPDVAQGFQPAHLLGYFMGYENIRQDWKTLNTCNLQWWQYGLAGLDLVWNAALGVSMVYGVMNGLARTIWSARTLVESGGPLYKVLLPVGELTMEESAVTRIPFRVLHEKKILMPVQYLAKNNPLRVLGALAHEITHAEQEFGALGRVLAPLQEISVASIKGWKSIVLFLPGYLWNPVEVQAASAGLSSGFNLLFLAESRFTQSAFNFYVVNRKP
jgi:hypothetical protein